MAAKAIRPSRRRNAAHSPAPKTAAQTDVEVPPVRDADFDDFWRKRDEASAVEKALPLLESPDDAVRGQAAASLLNVLSLRWRQRGVRPPAPEDHHREAGARAEFPFLANLADLDSQDAFVREFASAQLMRDLRTENLDEITRGAVLGITSCLEVARVGRHSWGGCWHGWVWRDGALQGCLLALGWLLSVPGGMQALRHPGGCGSLLRREVESYAGAAWFKPELQARLEHILAVIGTTKGMKVARIKPFFKPEKGDPGAPVCPHCNSAKNVTGRLYGPPGRAKTHGVWKCTRCKVPLGTDGAGNREPAEQPKAADAAKAAT